MENSSVDLNVSNDDIPLGFSVSVVGENFGDNSSSSPMNLSAGCSFMINHMNGIRICESSERNLPLKSTCKTDEIAGEDDDLVNKENEPQTRNSGKKKNSSSKKSRNSKSTKVYQKSKTDGRSMTFGAEETSRHGSADKRASQSFPKLNKPTVGKTLATGDASSTVLRFLSKKDFIIDEIGTSDTPAKSDGKRFVKTPSPQITQHCPVDEICEFAGSEINLPGTRKEGKAGCDFATTAKSDRKQFVKTPSPQITQQCLVDEICELDGSEVNLPRTRKEGKVGCESASPANSDRKRLVKTPSPQISQHCLVDEICDLADSEINLPRTRKEGEVGCDKSLPTNSKCNIVKEISQWAIAFMKGNICVEGYVRGRNNESTLLRTSSVTDVLDSGRMIVTSGGSRYRLQGKIFVNAALEAGVSINIANKFINGFPPGWKMYCRSGAKLIGSENGSYQADVSSNQGDFSHPIFSDEKRGSKTIPMPVSEDSLSMSTAMESSACNNDSYKIPAAMQDKVKLASTAVGPKITKYASALTPVPELSKVPDPGAFASPGRPSVAAVALTSRPEQRKCRSSFKPPPRISGGTPAVRRTRSGRIVKPVMFRAELLQSLERSLPKRSPTNGRNSVSTTKKKKLTPATFPTPIFAPALGKKTKNAKKNEEKKRKLRKSAKMLYTPDTKLESAKITTPAGNRKKSEPGKGKKNVKSRTKTTKTAPEVETVPPTPQGAILSWEKDEIAVAEEPPCKTKKELKGKKSRKNMTKTSAEAPEVETVPPTPQGAILSWEKDEIAVAEEPPCKTKKELKRKKSRKNMTKTSAETKEVPLCLSVPEKQRVQIDVAELPMTRLQRRSYRVPISPLEVKETAAKFKTTTGRSKSKEAPKKKAAKTDKQKTRGTKRPREGGDIARARKRSKKSEDQVFQSTTPSSGGTKENDEVFIVADNDALNIENSHKRPATKKKKVEAGTTKVANTQKKWTQWQKKKLKKFADSVNEIDWNKISEQMGFPANECEQVYTDMFRKKQKVAPKEKTDTGPVEITARVGTMKHRQQVRHNLEAMKKPKFQDLFTSEGPGIGNPVDDLFSADLFSAPGASGNFVPLTPNSRPPFSFDATMATPAWFKTPTSSDNAFGFDGCTPVGNAQTPAALKQIFSPQRTKDAGDKEGESKAADRIIVQMRKQLMRGTLRELTQKKETAQKNRKPSKSQKKKKKNAIDFGVIADCQSDPAEDEEDSDKDEYFDFDE